MKKEFIKNCLKCNTEFIVLRDSKFNFRETKQEKKHCSYKCSHSRVWEQSDKEKKSNSLKKYYEDKDSPLKGKQGKKHSNEEKQKIKESLISFYDIKGRLPKEHFSNRNRYGVAKYRANKKSLTPENANISLIKEIYRNCPKGYDVDHIIPISEGCLHHEDNLQYLPASENRKKGRTQKYNKDLIINWKDKLKN